MAIVPNKDGQGIKANGYYSDVDLRYESPNGYLSSKPNATVTSLYSGELRYDNTNDIMYMSLVSGTNDKWVKVNEMT